MNTRVLSSTVCGNLRTYIYISSKPYFTTSAPFSRNQSSVARMNPAGSRKRKPSSPPSFRKMASQRIAVLDSAIAAIDSRTDIKPKKLKKLNEHLAEKADLERQLSQPDQDRDGIPGGADLQNTLPMYVESGGEQASVASPKAPTPRDIVLQKLRSRPPRVQTPSGLQQSALSRPTSQPTTPRQLGGQQQAPDLQAPGKGSWRSPSAPGTQFIRDSIVPPSSASGGTPEPSPAYLQRALLPPQPASQPQHILLVIDLNGTILHRPDRKRPTHFVERQSTRLFLDYVFSRFQVMIWSSARPENVKNMCNTLFPGPARQRLVAEWSRNRMGLTPEDYNKRVQVYKRLEKIWADPAIQSRHPLNQYYGWTWDQSNTILIDDSLEKARSEPSNLVELPEFVGRAEPSDVLRQLSEYLDGLLMQKDVSAYIRQTPFKPTP